MTQQTLSYVQVILSVILILLVLIQYSEAGAGSAFGGGDGSSGFHTRRGIEKTIFYTTIVFGILFIASSFAQLIIK